MAKSNGRDADNVNTNFTDRPLLQPGDPPPLPRKMNSDIPHVLPHEKVFPIQIGSELFRLSGASISSDAPSYFSQFFQTQLQEAAERGDSNGIRTLYIDRDPVTFADISRHLQGYHVEPRNGSHFVKLFADAQFYSLPRLISQLYEETIFISIGHQDFQIPKTLFSAPGNSPNFFTLGFAVFFSSPTEVFPGLSRSGLLRPPSILPPSVPNRSAAVFSDILHLLRGYPLHIRSPEHREELLRDCRYFHLKGLEQKLIKCSINFNLIRERSEITLRLEDLRPSGISVMADQSLSTPAPLHPGTHNHPDIAGWVNYMRPFEDKTAHELVLEISEEATKVDIATMRATFYGETKTRITRLFEVIATKLNLPSKQPLGLLMVSGGASSQPASPGNTPISEDQVRIVVDRESHVVLDGRGIRTPVSAMDSVGEEESESAGDGGLLLQGGSRKRKRARGGDLGEYWRVGEGGTGDEEWIVRRGQWRLRVQNARNGRGGVECVLVAVKLDAVKGDKGRNVARGFLDE